MARRSSRIGWVVAAAIAGGWWFSDQSEAPLPRGSPAPRVQTTPSQPKPAPKAAVPTSVAPAAYGPQTLVLFTRSRVRVRAAPSTQAAVVATLETGQQVTSSRQSDQWHRVIAAGYSGWIRADLLTNVGPKPSATAPTSAPRVLKAPPVSRPSAEVPLRTRSGEPLREPYTGTCDCPYDRKRNGHLCGRTSAYSRPGGRAPKCYR